MQFEEIDISNINGAKYDKDFEGELDSYNSDLAIGLIYLAIAGIAIGLIIQNRYKTELHMIDEKKLMQSPNASVIRDEIQQYRSETEKLQDLTLQLKEQNDKLKLRLKNKSFEIQIVDDDLNERNKAINEIPNVLERMDVRQGLMDAAVANAKELLQQGEQVIRDSRELEERRPQSPNRQRFGIK